MLLIRPTLKIAGGFISVCRLGTDLVETEVRKLEVEGAPDHEWPGLFELVSSELAAGHRRFIIDLRAVPWMNSRGLGRLIELWTLVGKSGGQAALVCGPGRILTILEISQVSLIMNPFQTLADAVASLSATA
jgi:anti-anti-sigma factor